MESNMSESNEKIKISEILPTEYDDFKKFCNIAGKIYRDELTSVDYVAYRSQFGRSREEVKELREFIDNYDNSKLTDVIEEIDKMSESTEFVSDDSNLYEGKENNENESASKEYIEPNDDGSKMNSYPIQKKKDSHYLEKLIEEDSDMSYASALGISLDDLEDIRIDGGIQKKYGVDLSIRSHNVLKKAKCTSLRELMLFTPQQLFSLKNLGVKSLREIESVIYTIAEKTKNKEYINPESANRNNKKSIRTKIVSETFQSFLRTGSYKKSELTDSENNYIDSMNEVKEEIGEEFCESLLKSEYVQEYVSLLCYVLNEYYNTSNIISETCKRVRDLIKNAPDNILHSRLKPYVQLYIIEANIEFDDNFKDFMNEEANVEDYAELVREVLTNLKYIEKKDREDLFQAAKKICEIGEWISNIDLEGTVQRLLDFTNPKEQRIWDILRKRASGMTLEYIASEMGLTRERVRQIEKKALRVIDRRFKFAKYNVFGLVSLVRDGDSVLQRQELSEVIGKENSDILWYCLSRKYGVDCFLFDTTISHYDDKHDLVVVTLNESKSSLDKNKKYDVLNKIIESLPELIETEQLNQMIVDKAMECGIHDEICKIAIKDIYRVSGKFSYKGRLTVVQMCDFILKTRFQNGFKIADEICGNMFMKYLEELFSFSGHTTHRAIDAKIMEIGVLFDRGKYIHKDYISVEQSVIDEIYNYVENSSKSAITYSEIYVALEDILVGTQITNRYALQGILKLYGSKYESHRDYISKGDGGNVADELTVFIGHKGLVHKSEIFEEFPGWKDYNLSFILPRCPEIISLDSGYFMHSDMLQIDNDEKQKILNYMQKNINEIPVSSRYFFDEFMMHFSTFMIENEINTHGKLFGILQYLFKDIFYFSRPYIAKEKIGEITNKSVLLKHLESVDSIDIDDFIDICKQNAVHYISTSYLLDEMQPEWIRVDERTLMQQEKVGLTEEIIQEVADLINETAMGHEGYIAAKSIDDFSWYPTLKIPWTSFLLESIASMIPTSVKIINVMSTSMEFPHAIFVSDEFEEDDWNSLLVKVLKKEHAVEPFRTKKDIYDWLQQEGLCNINFPAFLETEHHVYEDGEGILHVE